MAASSALTAETICAVEEGTALEMVTMSTTSSTMGESMAEITFSASETMGSVGGGIAESAEMTSEEMATSMETSATANAALGQSVSNLSEFEGSAFEAIEMTEFSPQSVPRQTFTSTPFIDSAGVAPSFDMSLEEENEFEELFYKHQEHYLIHQEEVLLIQHY